MKFSEYRISPKIKDNLEKLGFRRPTDIQYKSIPPILNREDVLAIAQTGTGKTAAFAIPVLHMIQERKTSSKGRGLRCLVMVPTRELALQIAEEFNKFGKGTKVKVAAIVGGVDQDPQIQQLAKGLDIAIATPGRLFDLSAQGHLKLENIEVMILDEADHMLDLGFLEDIQSLVRKLPRRRQTLFFSATIDEKIKKLAYSLVKKAIRIQISPKNPVARNVTHSVAMIEMDDKRFFLERLLKEHEEKKTLVFVRTQVRAERVVKAMERVQISATSIHGGKDQKDRIKVLEQFRTGVVKTLIATDVSARGIDIRGVDQVINYDLPDKFENYVHRVGRTGRGNQKGRAVSFCSSGEKELLTGIEEYIGGAIDRITIDKTEYQDTIDYSEDNQYNWKALIAEEDRRGRVGKECSRWCWCGGGAGGVGGGGGGGGGGG
ncbi:MAG: DEAD/DEAH box helicase, partial [Bacteroidota bacterium]